ncbi:MAG: sugar phosphate isomerase/epimerase family protein [bacterium]
MKPCKGSGIAKVLACAVMSWPAAGASAADGAALNPFFAMDTCRPKEQLDLLKDLGYAGFSWVPSGSMKAELDAAHSRGLKIFAVYTGSRLKNDKFQNDQATLIASLKDTETAVWLTVQSDSFKKSDEAGDLLAVPALQTMADNAASNSVRIALYPHTGFWVESVQDAIRIARKVNRPNFGVTFNLCHCLMVGDEAKIPELLTQAGKHLFLVTIDGADKDAGGTNWDRLIRPLDEGSMDLLPILKKLREIGYSGPIGLQGYGVKVPPLENLTRSWKAWQKYNERLLK